MPEHFDVLDRDAGRSWCMDDEAEAIRYASGRHAHTGNVVEVVRSTPHGASRILVLPSGAPLGRP